MGEMVELAFQMGYLDDIPNDNVGDEKFYYETNKEITKMSNSINVLALQSMSDCKIEQPVTGRLVHLTGQYGNFWKLMDNERNEVAVKFWKDCEPKGIAPVSLEKGMDMSNIGMVVTLIPTGKGKTIGWSQYNGKFSLNINPGYKMDTDSNNGSATIQQDAPKEFTSSEVAATPIEHMTRDIAKKPPVGDPMDIIRRKLNMRLAIHNQVIAMFGDKKLTPEHLQVIESGVYISCERESVDKMLDVKENIPF